MDNESWLQELNEDMLPQPYNTYAQYIGIDNLYKLTKMLGGTTIYIPKPESLFRDLRNKKIKQEYTGYNINELALKYDLCERSVRNIIENVTPVLPGQVSLFEE